MKAKYIFRLDDICENMNWENYYRIKKIFLAAHIKPLLGVIPENQDIELLKYSLCKFDFWDEIKNLQDKLGWNIALHGYNHVFETKDSGLLKINKKSEFAGVLKTKQHEKIMKGKKRLLKKGIAIDAFMAPAHSFDETTIQCLKENGISAITDGYGIYPYYQDDILFVPQLLAKPRKLPFGIYTWCLHINTMAENDINDLEEFIKANGKDIISFSEAKKYIRNPFSLKVQSFMIKSVLMAIRKFRSI